MANVDGADWSLVYPNPKSDTRVLISLPSALLRDLQLLAKAREVSTTELIRQAMTEEIAAEVRARPEIAASFKGQLPPVS